MYNVGDLIGRCVVLIDGLLLKSRRAIVLLTLARSAFIPAFYFTAKYGAEGYMIFLTILLGLSNGYVTVSIFVNAPKGYLVRNAPPPPMMIIFFFYIFFNFSRSKLH
jgi:equilibrative nucleoside transporter 1/2/3